MTVAQQLSIIIGQSPSRIESKLCKCEWSLGCNVLVCIAHHGRLTWLVIPFQHCAVSHPINHGCCGSLRVPTPRLFGWPVHNPIIPTCLHRSRIIAARSHATNVCWLCVLQLWRPGRRVYNRRDQ